MKVDGYGKVRTIDMFKNHPRGNGFDNDFYDSIYYTIWDSIDGISDNRKNNLSIIWGSNSLCERTRLSLLTDHRDLRMKKITINLLWKLI